MKNLIFILLAVFLSKMCFTQISPKDSNKIFKILGKNFIELTPQKSYPYSSLNENVIADTSLTIVDDTTGIYFNNEFLLFRSAIHFKEGSEVKKMISTNYVTVAEYHEFQNYVRDSMARELITMEIQDDMNAEKWVLYDKKLVNLYPEKKISSKNRLGMSQAFPLNWKMKLDYNDLDNEEIMPILSTLYIPYHSQFYRQRIIDEKKLLYKYSENNRNLTIPTLMDIGLWAKNSKSSFDEFSILAQIYASSLNDMPTIGINGKQAKAFCQWKQEQLQKTIDENKMNLKVIVTLPAFHDLSNLVPTKFFIPQKNYTFLWQISNEQYATFIASVKDSTIRELLLKHNSHYQYVAMRFLKHSKKYFDQFCESVTVEDYPFEVDYARELFPLDLSYKIKRSDYSGFDYKDIFLNDKESIEFKYFYRDYKLPFKISDVECVQCQNVDVIKTKYLNKTTPQQVINSLFREGNISLLSMYGDRFKGTYRNCTNIQTVVTSILPDTISGRKYITEKRKVDFDDGYQEYDYIIDTIPDPLAKETQIIKKITYEQALAFYHWKYPIQKIKSTDNWQDYVLPTKEQFERIQRGEQIIVEEKKVEFPSPVFRYVVHFYSKN